MQQRAQIAKGQPAKGERNELHDGGFKMTERKEGVAQGERWRRGGRGCAPQARRSPGQGAVGASAERTASTESEESDESDESVGEGNV